MSDWNPSLYLHFAAERSRPAVPLNDRVRRWSCLPGCRWRISNTLPILAVGQGNTLPILAVAQVTAPPFYTNVGLLPG